MKRAILKLLFGAILAVGCLPAAAVAMENPNPWVAKVPRGGAPTKEERSQEVKRIVADCVVKSGAVYVATFLNIPTTDPDFAKAESIIRRTMLSCMSAKIGYGASATFAPRDTIFVGLLSQAMMRFFAKPTLPIIDESSYDYKHSYTEATSIGNVQRMAFCLAGNQPNIVVEVISSRPGSQNEAQEFSALNPAISACLTKGTTLTIGRPEFRALLAEALYHRLIAPITQKQIESWKAVPRA